MSNCQIPPLGNCDFCNEPVRVSDVIYNGALYRADEATGEKHYAHLRCLSECVGGKFEKAYQKHLEHKTTSIV